ncbi:MAG: hypothetical protein GY832_21930 [Chloroflexi bacterium]|nr:hypothetical protein [Chloroflexota bacterium]
MKKKELGARLEAMEKRVEEQDEVIEKLNNYVAGLTLGVGQPTEKVEYPFGWPTVSYPVVVYGCSFDQL